MKKRNLELLSPAKNKDIAIQAILHGADAVYMGATSHGARKAAGNNLEDIAYVVDYAHQFHSKVYVTVNTIIYDNEVKQVEQLCKDLYNIGADALIVQDMGILRMKLPPIALHASTQCDIRTPQKAKFLEMAGFSQLVLARELTLEEIKEITDSVNIPVECFIHGALCVSYSGRCHASLAMTGRSANRGECAQICRLPFTLKDSNGKILTKDRYLLSLKDFNASERLENLIDAGVSSFKIEGRLKEENYVKNITAFYNQRLNQIIKDRNDNLARSSYGEVTVNFAPDTYKSFNRGFTDYFLNQRQPSDIASLLTPKSLGEPIKELSKLNNGDGISFFDKDQKFTGVNINRVEGSKLILAKDITIPLKTPVYRTSDVKWDKLLNHNTSTRKIKLNIKLAPEGIYAEDERGIKAFVSFDIFPQKAEKPFDYKIVFEKLGNTIYILDKYESTLGNDKFYPISWITKKRRELIELLDKQNKQDYKRAQRIIEDKDVLYMTSELDYRDNVSNQLSRKFYADHGVNVIEDAAELQKDFKKRASILMTTRHCILRELGMCRKKSHSIANNYEFPLSLCHEKGEFILDFDCRKCEMKVLNGEN